MRRSEEEILIRDDSGLLYDDSVTFVVRPRPGDWCYKVKKTLCLALGFFVIGLCIALPGPTLLDLAEKINTDISHISTIFSARAVGYLLGAILGGTLFNFFDKQLLMFCTLLIASVATVVVPWCLTLVSMAALVGLQGVSLGILYTGGNMFCVKLWGRKSAPYIQTLHFAFAVGAFLAPIVARPFLSNENLFTNTTAVTNENTALLNKTRNERSVLYQHNIYDFHKAPDLDNLHGLDSSIFLSKNRRFKRDEGQPGGILSTTTTGSATVHHTTSTSVPVIDNNIIPMGNSANVSTTMGSKTAGPNGTSVLTSTESKNGVTSPSTETTKPPTSTGSDNVNKKPVASSDKHLNQHPDVAGGNTGNNPDSPQPDNTGDTDGADLKENIKETVDTSSKMSPNANSTEVNQSTTTKAPGGTASPKDRGIVATGKDTIKNGTTITATPASNPEKETSSSVAESPLIPPPDVTNKIIAPPASTHQPTTHPHTTTTLPPTTTTTPTTITTTPKPTTTTTPKPTTTTTPKPTTTTTPKPTTTTPKPTTTTTPKPTTTTTPKPTTTTTPKPTTTTTSAPTSTKKITAHPSTKVSTKKHTSVPVSMEPSKTSKASTQASSKVPPTAQSSNPTESSTVISTTTKATTEAPKKPTTAEDIFNKAKNLLKTMSKIQFAYGIVGAVAFLFAVLYLVLYCFNKKRLTLPSENEYYEGIKSNEGCFKGTVLFMLFIFFICYVGLEVAYSGLVTTFAVRFNHWPKEQGAVVVAIFWGSVAVGRGFSIFFSRCCGATLMLAVDLCLMVFGGLVLSVGIYFLTKLLWLGALILGLGMSSVLPSVIAWTENYFTSTGKATAVFVMGSVVGEMFMPILTTYLFTVQDEMVLMRMALALSAILLVLFLVMSCYAVKNGQTFSVRDRNGFLPLQAEDERDENMEMDLIEFDASQTRKRKSKGKADAEYKSLISDLEED